MAKLHDTKIWDRILEAYRAKGVKGNPTAIARELKMAQVSVREWQTGKSTPSTSTIRKISDQTGFRSDYLADGTMPKLSGAAFKDEIGQRLLDIYEQLWAVNRGRLFAHAERLLDEQKPLDDENDSDELQRP